MPTRPTTGRTLESVGGAPHHARPNHFSTALGAAGGKGKNSKAAKKKKNGSSRGGGGGSGGSGGSNSGGGFGASTTATAVKPSGKASTTTTPTSTSTGAAAGAAAAAVAAATATTHGPSRPAALLPDDDFATFPPLSPDTLKSVMGVDVFDLPPGGVSARETSQQDALPLQVLDCIRDRHGFPEFAGGVRLLDTAYTEGTVGAGTGEDPTTAAAEAVTADGPLETLEGGGELSEGGKGRESPPPLLFPGLRLLHAEPPMIGVDDFFTAEECDQYISRSLSPPPSSQAAGAGDGARGGGGGGGAHKQRSATLGADVDAVAQVRMGRRCFTTTTVVRQSRFPSRGYIFLKTSRW